MLYSCQRFSSMITVIWKIWSMTPLCLDTYGVRTGRHMCMRAQLCLTLCNPMDCSWPGSSVHGIFQARVLEWVAIAFSEHILPSLLWLSCFWNHLDENPSSHKNAPPRSPATGDIADGQRSEFTCVWAEDILSQWLSTEYRELASAGLLCQKMDSSPRTHPGNEKLA